MGDEVVLADHAVAVRDEIEKQIKDTRFERDLLAAAMQFAPLGVEQTVTECDAHFVLPPATFAKKNKRFP